MTVRGLDEPGIAAALFAVLARLEMTVHDVEQVRVHGQLLLCVEAEGGDGDPDGLREAVVAQLAPPGAPPTLSVSVEGLVPGRRTRRAGRQLVTLLAPELSAQALGTLFGCITASGGNVERIARLARYPVTSYEMVVAGADPGEVRRRLGAAAALLHVDVAVQRAGLHRRAKHLIVLDVDSTLLQGEVIDLLAARAGHAEEVAALTGAAMAGEIAFADALRRRVGLLEGLPARALVDVRDELALAPGARTLVRTLKRLGYVTAVVSGGFIEVIEGVVADLGIDHVAANALEVEQGRLTGRLRGPVVDRAGKAAALVRFAELSRVPLAQTVAVGDGANDIDMLAAAGLGIAYNAKPVVRVAADTALNVPYLDAILYLLGITREEVEEADAPAAPSGPGSGAGAGGAEPEPAPRPDD